jgi:hypothetical protein
VQAAIPLLPLIDTIVQRNSTIAAAGLSMRSPEPAPKTVEEASSDMRPVGGSAIGYGMHLGRLAGTPRAAGMTIADEIFSSAT